MTDRVRIYQQPKGAMQSGKAGTGEWVLDYDPSLQQPDPLMGWVGGGDTQNQVRLRFDTQEDAVAYAMRHNLPYQLELPRPHRFTPKAYADNFKFGRRFNWSH
jgi:hypothetical protein